jgi:hypothetical protein
MTQTNTESAPGDNSADQLNADAAAENPTGDSPPTPEETAPEPAPEPVGVPTPAAGDTTSPPSSSPFADAWAEATNLWIHGHLRNSPLAEATQAWNHVMGKLPLLGALVETSLSSKKE